MLSFAGERQNWVRAHFWKLGSHWFQRKQSRCFMIFWRWVMFREVEGSPCRLRFAQTWPTPDVRIWPSIQKSDRLDAFRVVLLPQNRGYVVQRDTSVQWIIAWPTVLSGIIRCATVLSDIHLLSELAFDTDTIFMPTRFQVSKANDVEGMKSHNFITGQRFYPRGAMERFTGT